MSQSNIKAHSIHFRVFPPPLDSRQPPRCPLKGVLSDLGARVTELLQALCVEELVDERDLLLEQDLAVGGSLGVLGIALG